MAQAGHAKRTMEMKETLNSDYCEGQKITLTQGKEIYHGVVLGKWSNFGLVILLDGDTKSKIVNLSYDKISK